MWIALSPEKATGYPDAPGPSLCTIVPDGFKLVLIKAFIRPEVKNIVKHTV
jgi:hypothetical protein